jgi:S-adenosylmethionine decarboxylase
MRPSDPDFTLELLMTDLDEEVMKQFYQNPGVTAKSAAKSTGLAELFPEAIIDDYLFDPCGYSLNGLLGDGYFTIHITPQPNCSYASFETNIQCDYPTLIKRVLSVFKPKNFTGTLFAGHISREEFTKLMQSTLVPRLLDGQLCRRTYTRYEFENNYELAFAQYDHGRKRKDK